jgi:tRNA (uracil-5-)-methyltransferase TRM9
MDGETSRRLIDLNQHFYQTFANQFSHPRQRLQPGVQKILTQIPEDAVVLDLGCGNGVLWEELIKQGFSGYYVGVDSSPGMLAAARARAKTQTFRPPAFVQIDLSGEDWNHTLLDNLRLNLNMIGVWQFSHVLAFAVLHHLPGRNLQQRVLLKIHPLLQAEGTFFHSEWQFLNSEKLKSRLVPWSQINLDVNMVEEGDYLLDWRAGGKGLRYVHHFSENELGSLAAETGFHIHETFYSDGQGGKLSVYQRWSAVK